MHLKGLGIDRFLDPNNKIWTVGPLPKLNNFYEVKK